MRTRDIDSTPPATTTSATPSATFAAADSTASRPEQHNRPTTPAGTSSGQSAYNTAARNVAALVADSRARADEHVIDQIRWQPSVSQRDERLAEHVVGKNICQSPTVAANPCLRRADGIVDVEV
jgi:hypothetical protein